MPRYPTPEAGTCTQYVQVRGALGASRPAPPVRTQRGRLVRVARTYPSEAPGRTLSAQGEARPGEARDVRAVPPVREAVDGVRGPARRLIVDGPGVDIAHVRERAQRSRA